MIRNQLGRVRRLGVFRSKKVDEVNRVRRASIFTYMFPVLFRNITNTGSLISVGICIALSVVYLELDDEEQQEKLQAQLAEDERKAKLRQLYHSPTPPPPTHGTTAIGPTNKRT